jgi:hypothetical protein
MHDYDTFHSDQSNKKTLSLVKHEAPNDRAFVRLLVSVGEKGRVEC